VASFPFPVPTVGAGADRPESALAAFATVAGLLLAAEMEHCKRLRRGVWGWRRWRKGERPQRIPWGCCVDCCSIGHGVPTDTGSSHCKDHELGDFRPCKAAPGEVPPPDLRTKRRPLERLSGFGAKGRSANRQAPWIWPFGQSSRRFPPPLGTECALRREDSRGGARIAAAACRSGVFRSPSIGFSAGLGASLVRLSLLLNTVIARVMAVGEDLRHRLKRLLFVQRPWRPDSLLQVAARS